MKLEEALQLYKIPYIVTDIISGAGFTSYKLTPRGSSATIQRLKTRLPDLESVTGCNLEIITDSTGVYLRIKDGQTVYNYMDYNGYIDYKNPDIPFIVGFNNGEIILDDIDSARHILIAGTTGSGKSVFLHDLILSLLLNDNCNLFLVDCKRVEFSIYKNHCNVCSEVFGTNSAARFASFIIDNMESRYADMERAGVNNYTDYIKLYPDKKRLILVIDELSDLIGDKESRRVLVPQLLRIAQKGRAAGCHIILATQRPDSTVINGTLKGNIPTRVAFRTLSNTDSRIILDRSGAEHLTGSGDGLYLRNGAQHLERIQAPFITLEEISRIA